MASRLKSAVLRDRLKTLSPWAIAVPGVIALAIGFVSYGLNPVDDAYISLTYARNFAGGDGLVFHPLLQVTEGYSNLLWTLMLAVGLKLGFTGATLATGLGWMISAATLGILCRRIGGMRGVGIGVALGFSPIFSYWSGRGLETGLVSLLLLNAVLRLGTLPAWLCFGLLGVSRVEGVVWGGMGVLYALIRGERRPDLKAAALWLGPTLAQLAFRALYYGTLTPAPVLAKGRELDETTFKAGLTWLSGALTAEPILSVTLVACLALCGRAILRRQPMERAAWALLSVVGLMLFSIAVGGDWMPNLRWLVPAIPLVWLAAHELIATNGQLAVLVGLAIILGLQTGQVSQGGDTSPRQLRPVMELLRNGPPPAAVHPATLFVLENLSEDTPVVQPDVGLLSWLTNNPIMDPQGLTWMDAAIAQRTPPTTPEHIAAVERVAQYIQTMKPGMLGLTVRDGRPVGPASEAVLGSRQDHPPAAWFVLGWTLWREEEYSKGMSIRYFLRNDITERLSPRARMVRYEAALQRSPTARALLPRVSWTLRQLDRSEEARQIDATLAPQDRKSSEVWSR